MSSPWRNAVESWDSYQWWRRLRDLPPLVDASREEHEMVSILLSAGLERHDGMRGFFFREDGRVCAANAMPVYTAVLEAPLDVKHFLAAETRALARQIVEEGVKDISLRRAWLPYVQMPNVDLTGVDLNGALVVDANLTGSKLEDVQCRESSFRLSDLSGTIFNNADCSQAKFCGANLRNASLYGANFNGTTFYMTNFVGVSHMGAADFTDADLAESFFEPFKPPAPRSQGSRVAWRGMAVMGAAGSALLANLQGDDCDDDDDDDDEDDSEEDEPASKKKAQAKKRPSGEGDKKKGAGKGGGAAKADECKQQ